jgi:hypothetical protein
MIKRNLDTVGYKRDGLSRVKVYLLVKTTPHATEGNNKQGANYRLQRNRTMG